MGASSSAPLVPSSASNAPMPPTIHQTPAVLLHVKLMSGDMIPIEVSPSARIWDLKMLVCEQRRELTVGRQRLFIMHDAGSAATAAAAADHLTNGNSGDNLDGIVLLNERSLDSYGIGVGGADVEVCLVLVAEHEAQKAQPHVPGGLTQRIAEMMAEATLFSPLINAPTIRAMLDACEVNSQLSLRHEPVTAAGGALLAAALQDNYTVSTLTLGNCALDDSWNSAARQIATLMRENKCLTELELGDNALRDTGTEAIAAALTDNRSIGTLRLTYNGVGAGGAAALARALEHNVALTELNLNANCLGHEGVAHLAGALRSNRTLRVLHLKGNTDEVERPDHKMHETGAHALADALLVNSTLTMLDVSNNEIGDVGGCALAAVLQQPSTALTTLTLARNALGDATTTALGTALAQNTTLTVLDASQGYVTGAGVADLAGALMQNQTLLQIDLSVNGVGDTGARALAATLCHSSLTSLNLSSNSISEFGADALQEALAMNARIRIVSLGGNQCKRQWLQQ